MNVAKIFLDFPSYVTEMRERQVMKIFSQNEFIKQISKTHDENR